MSDIQPKTIFIETQRHGEKIHVTRVGDTRFPSGNPDKQPLLDDTLAYLREQGYSDVREVPGYNPAQKRLSVRRPDEPTLFEKISGQKPDVEKRPDTAPELSDDELAQIRDDIKRRHRL